MTTTKTLPTEQAPAAVAAPAAPASSALSISSLVLGISGIALGQGMLAIVAVVLGFIARSKEPAGRTLANWGLVLGFVGLFGGLVVGLIGFAAFVPFWFAGMGSDIVNLSVWDFWRP